MKEGRIVMIKESHILTNAPELNSIVDFYNELDESTSTGLLLKFIDIEKRVNRRRKNGKFNFFKLTPYYLILHLAPLSATKNSNQEYYPLLECKN